MQYRKKPVVIEALKWEGDNLIEIADFCGSAWSMEQTCTHGEMLIIKTLEGQHMAKVGDYIIKGVKGEFYPCKPDVFELTYEAV